MPRKPGRDKETAHRARDRPVIEQKTFDDLLVVSDALGYQDLIRALQPAERRLGRKISPTLYSAAELAKKRSGRNAFVLRILEQPKIFLIGSDRDFE
mgnify:CR=1 FL=1